MGEESRGIVQVNTRKDASTGDGGQLDGVAGLFGGSA